MRAGLDHLPRIDVEVLRQQRHVDGAADGLEVGQRAAEVALRRQHRDGGGAGGLVGLGRRPGSRRARSALRGRARLTSAMIESPSPASAPAKWRVSRRFATSLAVQLPMPPDSPSGLQSRQLAAADDQVVQRRLGGAGIEGRTGLGDAGRQVGGPAARARGPRRRSATTASRFGPRARRNGTDGGRVVDGVAAAQLLGLRLREAQRRRRDRLLADALRPRRSPSSTRRPATARRCRRRRARRPCGSVPSAAATCANVSTRSGRGTPIT